MRAPRYGELTVTQIPSAVYQIWLHRNDELPELPSWRWSFEHETDLSDLENRELVAALMERANLKPRERMAIALVVVHELTLEQAGKRMKCTQERVRQMMNKGLRRCRHPHAMEGVVEPVPIKKRSTQ